MTRTALDLNIVTAQQFCALLVELNAGGLISIVMARQLANPVRAALERLDEPVSPADGPMRVGGAAS